MPANLTPEFKAAEAAYRRARDPKERLECLREMLRTIPKHKGTDHLQGDIRRRIKELTEELAGPKKGGIRGGPPTVIRPEGAAQVAILGPPNSGKSALHARLTGSNAESAPYPFTTQFPQPGMMPFEDIYFQLVDLPPLSPDHPVPWLANALQPADACLLVVDLGDPDCVGEVAAALAILDDRHVTLVGQPEDDSTAGIEEDALRRLFTLRLPTLMLASKADHVPGLQQEIEVFWELTGLQYPVVAASAVTGQGLDRIGPWLFRTLGIARVYTKAPGKPADLQRPFTVRRGHTVQDVAMCVHKHLAHSLKYARLWRGSHLSGQQVGPEHSIEDGDVLELHT
jgi:ribosome-interacting GTPase 1